MKDLPSVRASFLEPFYLAAKDMGAPVESQLQSVGLPAHLPEEKELLLLETNCWKFVHAIANREYCPTFGLIAGEKKPWTKIVTIQPLFKDCLNLFELLKRLVIIAPTQSLTSRFAIIEDGDFIWFVDLCPRLLPEQESAQVGLFRILGMMQLVQACAGNNWRPQEIHLTIKYNFEVENARQLNPSRILFSQPFAKFKIPRKLLSLPIAQTLVNNCVGVEDINSIEPMPETFVDQLVATIIPYMGAGVVNKKIIAEALDISPRTLQRRLQECSTSYSLIIDNARFKKAQTLLKNSDLTLLNISLLLGYQNASSFTRAFRRWAGVSPKEFRMY